MSEDGNSKGPELSADGTLEGRMNRVEPPAAFSTLPGAPKIELVEKSPKPIAPLPGPIEPAAPSKRSPLLFVFGAFGLGVLILAVALVRDVVTGPPEARAAVEVQAEGIRALETVETLLPSASRGQALIDSEPSGAQLWAFGRMIGITPWAGDNRFGSGEIELRLDGYKTWRGQVPDQDEAKLAVKMTK